MYTVYTGMYQSFGKKTDMWYNMLVHENVVKL